MNQDKFCKFIEYFDISFQHVIQEMSGLQVSRCDRVKTAAEEKFTVIIGIVQSNRGRILFEAEPGLVRRITEGMNDGPLENALDTYLYLSEFANTFCGNAISRINNRYENYELGLTPPALFAGTNMRIITPGIQSDSVFYTSEFGQGVLNIGFEGE